MTKKTIFSASASAGRHFIAGLMILLPLVLSFWILRFLLSKLDSILGPLFTKYIGFSIPDKENFEKSTKPLMMMFSKTDVQRVFSDIEMKKFIKKKEKTLFS